jgi:CubicO group peptidase (beta-lactamase class C family)
MTRIESLACLSPRSTVRTGRAIKRGTLLVLSTMMCLQAFAGTEGAANYSARHGERALLIWEKGRLRMERYGTGGAPDRTENIYSITKSLCALAIFSAIGRNVLQLDEPVSLTLTEWRNDPQKRRITVRDLLNQTSGLSPGFEQLYAGNLRNKEKAALRLPVISPPGETFAYGPSHYEALEVLMARKLELSPLMWMEGALLNPLGIKPGAWRRDKLGNPYFSAGATLSARDLLAAGQLMSRRGWFRIFSPVPTALIRSASTGSSANPMYGLGFWLNLNAEKEDAVECDIEESIELSQPAWERFCLSKRAPSDLIAMVGSFGQRVYISPSQNLIIVRLGRGTGFRDPEFLRAFFR